VNKLVLLSLLLALAALPAAGLAAQVYVLDVTGVIDPPTAGYVERGLETAARAKAAAVVIRIDTPGGLMQSMRDITQDMLASRVPVITYVWPRGARAGSAGVFITMAGNVAAMAPGTNIGAAHPVAGTGEPIESEMKRKITNDAVAQIRAIAEERKRNAEWAEKAVRESVSITNRQAVKLQVVDLTAPDLGALLRAVDGRQVVVAGNRKVTLHTAGAEQVFLPPNFREKLLHALSDPNLAYILLLVGVYGLIFELSNPGAIFPGVAGGICLILAFYSLAVLPISYAGLALLLLGIGLLVADVFATSHGVLTVGGIIAFVAGSVMLTGARGPGLAIAWPVIISAAVVTLVFFLLVVGLGVRAQFRKVTTGAEGLVGAVGVARTDLAPEGTVMVQGELWKARAAEGKGSLAAGSRIKVLAVEGFELTVEPA